MVDAKPMSLCTCSIVFLCPPCGPLQSVGDLGRPSPLYIPPPSLFLPKLVAINSQKELGSWELPSFSSSRKKLTQDLPQSYSSLLSLWGGECQRVHILRTKLHPFSGEWAFPPPCFWLSLHHALMLLAKKIKTKYLEVAFNMVTRSRWDFDVKVVTKSEASAIGLPVSLPVHSYLFSQGLLLAWSDLGSEQHPWWGSWIDVKLGLSWVHLPSRKFCEDQKWWWWLLSFALLRESPGKMQASWNRIGKPTSLSFWYSSCWGWWEGTSRGFPLIVLMWASLLESWR